MVKRREDAKGDGCLEQMQSFRAGLIVVVRAYLGRSGAVEARHKAVRDFAVGLLPGGLLFGGELLQLIVEKPACFVQRPERGLGEPIAVAAQVDLHRQVGKQATNDPALRARRQAALIGGLGVFPLRAEVLKTFKYLLEAIYLAAHDDTGGLGIECRVGIELLIPRRLMDGGKNSIVGVAHCLHFPSRL